ncbi:hypothetical protein [Microbacterium gubbeenense]|uniref:hypothetical protein n=1 Tax=Microbacterium gubbeenense TaxID=159896 RepID=UPI003F959498
MTELTTRARVASSPYVDYEYATLQYARLRYLMLPIRFRCLETSILIVDHAALSCIERASRSLEQQ